MILRVPIDQGTWDACLEHAASAELGGVSRVRGADRRDALGTDQFIGQVGTAAWHLYWFGDNRNYRLSRTLQDRTPHLGDGGSDVLGTRLDVKTSLMRKNPDPWAYNLLVRPAERHVNTTYVLALVPSLAIREVLLVGWVTEHDLPKEPLENGPFAGAFRVPATQLTPLLPVAWDWINIEYW